MNTTTKKIRGLLLGAGLLALLGSVAAVAAGGHERTPAVDLLPIDTVIERATALESGRFVQAELHDSCGGYVYRVVVTDDDGSVRTLSFDAQDGRRLS